MYAVVTTHLPPPLEKDFYISLLYIVLCMRAVAAATTDAADDAAWPAESVAALVTDG